MFSAIVRKELFELLRSSKFAVSFGVCSVLILMAFFTGARQYRQAEEAYESAVKENLRSLEGRTDWYIDYFQIFMKPAPLASLVSGVSNDIGRTIEMRERGELTNRFSFYNEHILYAAFRLMDLEFIFKWILPLFAMLLGYDAVNGEKERGTLRLAFANAVPRAMWIGGKLAGNYLALVVPLLVPILAGILVWLALGIRLSSGEWIRFSLMVGGGMLYFGLFLAASILFSTLTHRSAHSFISLLAAWVVMVAFVPAASVLIAARLVNVPSADEISIEKSRMAAQLWSETQKQMSDYTASPKPGAAPQDMMRDFEKFMSERQTERQRKQDDFNERLNEHRRTASDARERLSLRIARISPTTSFSVLMDELAGTSLAMRTRFLEQARAYQEVYSRFLTEKRGGEPGLGGSGFRMIIRDGGEAEAPKPINPSEIPAFGFTEPSWQRHAASGAVDLAALALWNLLLLAAASVAFFRYDVR